MKIKKVNKYIILFVLQCLIYQPIFAQINYTTNNNIFLEKSSTSFKISINFQDKIPGINQKINFSNKYDLKLSNWLKIVKNKREAYYDVNVYIKSLDISAKRPLANAHSKYKNRIVRDYTFAIMGGLISIMGIIGILMNNPEKDEGVDPLVGFGISLLGSLSLAYGWGDINKIKSTIHTVYYFKNVVLNIKITNLLTGQEWSVFKEIPNFKTEYGEMIINTFSNIVISEIKEVFLSERNEYNEPDISFETNYKRKVKASTLRTPLLLSDDVELSSLNIQCEESDYNITKLLGGYKEKSIQCDIPLIIGENNIKVTVTDWCGKEKNKFINVYALKDLDNTVITLGSYVENIEYANNNLNKINEDDEDEINTNINNVIEINPDINIPITKTVNKNAIAVVIGNRNYEKKDIPAVEFADRDAKIVKKYLVNTLGFREGNIIYVPDASQSDFNSIFGTQDNYKGKLYNYIKLGESDIFIYYSGHGAPDPNSKQGYFMPVDCDPSLVALNGYSLNTFYKNLSKIDYKSLTVVIDACFSGASEAGMLLANISPVFIKVENQVTAKGNSIIFTSATGEQVSSWYPEKKHSLFTYYFLKALQGEADKNGDKNLTLGEIRDYIDDNVPYMARRLNNREQTPQFIGDESKLIVEY